MKTATISLRQFFNSFLIKKGRGIWPDEALATIQAQVCKGATSISCNSEADKSVAIVYKINQALYR